MEVVAIWFIGLVLALKAALKIWNLHAPMRRRLIAVILIVITSWIGLFFYDFMVEPNFRYG